MGVSFTPCERASVRARAEIILEISGRTQQIGALSRIKAFDELNVSQGSGVAFICAAETLLNAKLFVCLFVYFLLIFFCLSGWMEKLPLIYSITFYSVIPITPVSNSAFSPFFLKPDLGAGMRWLCLIYTGTDLFG